MGEQVATTGIEDHDVYSAVQVRLYTCLLVLYHCERESGPLIPK